MTEPDDYYAYHWLQAEIRGQRTPYCTRRALGRWQERLTSALLLAEWANVAPQAQVLHMHCGDGLVGAAVAKQLTGGHLTLLDCHVAAVETTRQTLHANAVQNTEVVLSDCAQAVRDRAFDSVLALLPKGRATWEQTVLDAASVLRTGGSFCLAGAKNAGIKSAAKFVARVFGESNVLAYKGGCRVLRAVKGAQIDLPESEYYTWRTIQTGAGGEQLEYVTKPGLFSWERLDDGTELLIEALHARPLQSDDRVLDIGCGSGVLALVASRQAHAGQVIGLDADCRAVEATRRTLAHNRVANAQSMLSDCGEAVSDQSFSAVVTNPPFHQERATTYAIAEQIVRDAASLLRKRGRLYLVANAFLKYKPIIEAAFGNAELLRQTNRFNVWYASKRR
jgi:16S rRNA (guanine1207-N2)-methyltransferase